MRSGKVSQRYQLLGDHRQEWFGNMMPPAFGQMVLVPRDMAVQTDVAALAMR